MKLSKPIVFLDLETTGTDVKEDRIVQLAFIKTLSVGVRETYKGLINPGIPIPAKATEVHGISDKDVALSPMFKDAAPVLIAMMEDADLAGFNSNKFDIPLLNNEFKRAGIRWDWRKHNFIDVGNLFKIYEPRTLAAAYKFYIGEDLLDAHSSEEDAYATLNVFDAQLQRYPELQDKTPEELALISNYNRKIVDLSGTFRIDEDGDYVFNYGKNVDKKAKSDISYLQWIVGKSTFDEDVKDICRDLIGEHFKKKNWRGEY